ncbi:MAG: alpha-galactosidase [Treponema sp.]|jgi:alpha-galactosidase|nr:alpha-galactosidase [Treponema sp.]
MVTRKYEGINYTESPLPAEWTAKSDVSGIHLVYAADQKKDGETIGVFSGERSSGRGSESGSPGVSIPIDLWTFDELASHAGISAEKRASFFSADRLAVQCGGWLSWSAGWELTKGESLPRRVLFLPLLRKLTNREGDSLKPEIPVPLEAKAPALPAEGWISGHFIIYLRVDNDYLCIASRDGGVMPPVSFRIHREARLVIAEVFCPGKTWKLQDTLAELVVFSAAGYFNFKDTLRRFYRQEDAFKKIEFLRGSGGRFPGGYESWYNHYTSINEKVILDDLDALGKTDNIVKLDFLDRQRPAVFQIDDGWEKNVGEWEVNTRRFPNGLAPLAKRIEEAGYIPGLWFAPFLVTQKSHIFTERPGWLLRHKNKQEVAAGFNHLWDGEFYCLDLSRKDVLDYLDRIIARAVDEWGFRYLKLDFLYAGFFSGAFSGGGTPYEHYERACALLTARTKTASGLPVAYLGCGCPLGPSYRHFPLSRIGADTREHWDWKLPRLLGHTGGPGAYTNLMDTIGRSYLNDTVYRSDPDVIFLRSKKCSLTENEKELIALVNFCLGSQIMLSDDPRQMSTADTALTRRLIKLFDILAGDEYGAVRLDRDVFRLESRSGKAAGLINLENRPWHLKKERDPVLFAAIGRGKMLTSRHPESGPGEMIFAPHTITIVV